MFDIGGWEFLLIAIIGIVVIGPKDLPAAIRTVSSLVRRARELAREFQSGLEDVAREAELDKLGDEMKGMVDHGGAISGLRNEIEGAIDGDNEIRHAMDFDRNWTDDELADFPSAAELAEREAAKKADPASENSIAPPAPVETADAAGPAEPSAPAETPEPARDVAAAEKDDTKSGKPA